VLCSVPFLHLPSADCDSTQHTATNSTANARPHTATHCNTLHRTATLCSIVLLSWHSQNRYAIKPIHRLQLHQFVGSLNGCITFGNTSPISVRLIHISYTHLSASDIYHIYIYHIYIYTHICRGLGFGV